MIYDRIMIEGCVYRSDDFRNDIIPSFVNKSDFHLQLFQFLKEWFSEAPTVTVKTSGSTGTPKQLQVSRQKMINSATLTCNFLHLKYGDKALLCLPLDYIAGKMMVVRAIVAELDLFAVQPDGNPLDSFNHFSFDFAAMIPLQVYNSLDNNPKQLENIKNVLIGGGAIDSQLEERLQPFTNNFYASYGMTETLSHIALRKLNGKDKSPYYKPFDSVKLTLDKDNSLIINAPLVADNILYTHDVAEIFTDGSFQIIGRKDNIINSGGIKIQPEVIEKMLTPLIDNPFAITSLPDEKLGEAVVLVTEKQIGKSLLKDLPKYCQPRKIIVLDKIPMTETGKIKRKELQDLLRLNHFLRPSRTA
ncbi:MAG: AMP-binding protein [Tannerella sp.]|jgi:O-succinylbenzoic acid--CoA ligase|nr:AMP-binding protein [Tannerella sp.]